MIEIVSIFITLALLAGVFFLSTFFIATTFSHGAPFIVTRAGTVKKILSLAQIMPETNIVDLGSGDGRLLFHFAKAGAKSVHGYEINPLLVWKAKKKIARLNLEKTIEVFERNFWDIDMSRYEIVYVFGISHIMRQLENKLKRELKPGTKVISQGFQFPSWKMRKKEGGVFLYII